MFSQEVKESIKKKQQDAANNASTTSNEDRPSSAAKKPRLEEGKSTNLIIKKMFWYVLATASNAEADLDRAEREIEQLRVDHEVALEKSERQVFACLALPFGFKCSFSLDLATKNTAC